ncbi:virion structural protein [Bacillus stercoris]|nr:virion structural protein [Bacillus stercoris]
MGRNIITNAYGKINTSFSGADIVATITPIGGKPRVFGELQTVSYSIYRPTTPVYSLGRINPKGVVRGQRTIAGSLIFTVFDRHVLKSVIDSYNMGANKNTKELFNFNSSELREMKKNMKTDEMPPFDINITFLNEYGNGATLNLYGVHILTEGQTMSIEDMITENTMQYIAMDIDLMDHSGLDVDGR